MYNIMIIEITFGLVLFTILIIVITGAIVVQDKKAVIVERFGKFYKILKPGIHIILPGIDRPKYVKWTALVEKNNECVEDCYINYQIPTNIMTIDVPSYEVFTKDIYTLEINSTVHYKIVDLQKAVYDVNDLWNLLQSNIQTVLFEITQHYTHSEITQNYREIKKNIQNTLSNIMKNHGVDITSVDIQNILIDERISEINLQKLLQEAENNKLLKECETKCRVKTLESETVKKITETEYYNECHRYKQLLQTGFTFEDIIELEKARTLRLLNSDSKTKKILVNSV